MSRRAICVYNNGTRIREGILSFLSVLASHGRRRRLRLNTNANSNAQGIRTLSFKAGRVSGSLVSRYAACRERKRVAWLEMKVWDLISADETKLVSALEPTLVSVLGTCAELKKLSFGRKVHSVARKKGFLLRTNVSNALLTMYAKCGCIDDAQKVFGEMPERDVISWTAAIAGLVDHNRCREALELFMGMRGADEAKPNEVTISKVLKACAQVGDLFLGKELHGFARKEGLYRWNCVASALLDMYSKCGCIDGAREVFDEMPKRDLISWNAMITALVDHDRCEKALELFRRMRDVGELELDYTTITKVLKACARLQELFLGQELHVIARKKGLCRRADVATALLHMYSKCGRIDAARVVFDEIPERNVIMWATMITGLLAHGRSQEAVDLLMRMKGADAAKLDQSALAKLFDASAKGTT